MKGKLNKDYLVIESENINEEEYIKEIFRKVEKRGVGFEYSQGKLKISIVDVILEFLDNLGE
jgi:hypothetical protein